MTLVCNVHAVLLETVMSFSRLECDCHELILGFYLLSLTKIPLTLVNVQCAQFALYFLIFFSLLTVWSGDVIVKIPSLLASSILCN
jgi:hypothetical protein